METVECTAKDGGVRACFHDGSDTFIPTSHVERSHTLQEARAAASDSGAFTIVVPPGCLHAWLHAVANLESLSLSDIVQALKVR
jgi:hypothetical protein